MSNPIRKYANYREAGEYNNVMVTYFDTVRERLDTMQSLIAEHTSPFVVKNTPDAERLLQFEKILSKANSNLQKAEKTARWAERYFTAREKGENFIGKNYNAIPGFDINSAAGAFRDLDRLLTQIPDIRDKEIREPLAYQATMLQIEKDDFEKQQGGLKTYQKHLEKRFGIESLMKTGPTYTRRVLGLGSGLAIISQAPTVGGFLTAGCVVFLVHTAEAIANVYPRYKIHKEDDTLINSSKNAISR